MRATNLVFTTVLLHNQRLSQQQMMWVSLKSMKWKETYRNRVFLLTSCSLLLYLPSLPFHTEMCWRRAPGGSVGEAGHGSIPPCGPLLHVMKWCALKCELFFSKSIIQTFQCTMPVATWPTHKKTLTNISMQLGKNGMLLKCQGFFVLFFFCAHLSGVLGRICSSFHYCASIKQCVDSARNKSCLGKKAYRNIYS